MSIGGLPGANATGVAMADRSLEPIESKQTRSFYRPELDALRFFAFLCVFFFHGPRFTATATMSGWRQSLAHGYDAVTHGFGASLPLFFLLSSYLISELLLKEHAKTGTIHLKAFYMRRILRIWPLYYFGVALAIAASLLLPGRYHVSWHQILYFTIFVGWLAKSFNGNPMGPLWSISVEEVFYLIWPGVIKAGGRRSLALASAVIVPLSLFFAGYLNNWYNPLSHFIFFASGALLALALHDRTKLKLSPALRLCLIMVGLTLWAICVPVAGSAPTLLRGSLNFVGMDLGCIAVFLAFYDLPPTVFARPVLYLGQISYGLYVFHLAMQFIVGIGLQRLGFNLLRWPTVVLTLLVSLLATVIVASASYRWLEVPFLKLKQRFTFVKSGAQPTAA